MALRYDETALWKRTLGATSSDTREASALAVLRSTFETAHERVKPIVRQAHQDCQGLTVHDETHLDALWQMADIVCGDDYPINPLESFIFGCSVLFHDSALAVAAYEGGLDAVKATPEWRRAIDQLSDNALSKGTIVTDDARKQYETVAVFTALRSLHAKQAFVMAEREWPRPNGAGSIFIIEDTELRDYYGQVIGRIAQSHHWDIDRVAREFAVSKAPPPSLPPEWSLNELKIAVMLRCADAVHIDQRRAPMMEQLLFNPKGISAQHWLFQSRLGIPQRGESSIIYTSGRDFGRSEADAWWLCFDTCRMISGELQAANSVLKEADTASFYASKVEGVQRPKLFAKFVRCDGWEPVDAEVRVTDPITLAQTLGGRNLYGVGYEAPIRELLQNAIDASRLRSTIGREDFVAKVRVTLEQSNDGDLKLVVEDNGIGMSERVLTQRLLDFGKSGWRSDDVAQENPDISLSSIKVGGKFGIGFFAVFLLGDDVTVITRKHKAGLNDGLALEFVGLSRRPILRKASDDEQSDTYTTRVVVNVTDRVAKSGMLAEPGNSGTRGRSRANYGTGYRSVHDYLRWLLVSADVDIEFVDKLYGQSFTHSANWKSRASEELIKDLVNESTAYSRSSNMLEYSDNLSDITEDGGRCIGRAAILINGRDTRGSPNSFATVGGLTYRTSLTIKPGNSNTSIVPHFIGIIEGEVNIATRGQASLAISPRALANWASDQAIMGLSAKISSLERMDLARSVYWAGGDPGALPIAYYSGRLVDLVTLKKLVNETSEMFLPVQRTGSARTDYEWMGLENLGTRYHVDAMADGFCIMAVKSSESVLIRDDEDKSLDLVLNTVLDEDAQCRIAKGSYDILFDIIEKAGIKFIMRYEQKRTFSTGINVGQFHSGMTIAFERAV